MATRSVRGRPRAPRVLDAAGARGVAFDLLSRKAWTRAELDRRLRRRGAPAAVATTVVTDLEARGYLDDRAFAAAWAEGRARGRALGPWRLRAELLQRGVDRSIVEEAVGRVSAEMAPEGLARTAAARRAGGLARLTPERAARRLADFLTRRGFSREVVRRVVGETTGAAFSDS